MEIRKMKKFIVVSLLVIQIFSMAIIADTPTLNNTPTKALQSMVNSLIAVAGDKTINELQKKQGLENIIHESVDFESLSRRIISKAWKKSSKEEQKEFKGRFQSIMVNTYFGLLQNYSNEKVVFGKAQLKKKKYAIVDTKIISGAKKISVRYRLVKTKLGWKIYDFIPEGISMVASYKKNYAAVLRKKGLSGLIVEMDKIELLKVEKLAKN
jgi:phospholipid transport system substrate-binding protein